MKPKVSDTLQEFLENPSATVIPALGFGADAFFDAQAHMGQKEVEASEELPRDLHNNTQEQFESVGFTFGEPGNDPCFRPGTLPKGWTKQGKGYWTNIYDEKKRIRGEIFYKAHFFEREAFMHLTSRFHYKPVDVGPTYNAMAVVDSGTVVFQHAEVVPHKDDEIEAWREAINPAHAKCEAACKQWLIDHGFPDWKNPLLYWD